MVDNLSGRIQVPTTVHKAYRHAAGAAAMRGMARAASRLAAGVCRARLFSSHVVMETLADADTGTAIKFTLDLYAKRGLDLSLLRNCVSAPAVPVPSSPSSSRLRLVLPFRRCAQLRSLYNLFGSSTELRVGRVLEDLDTFVADIAHRHGRRCAATRTPQWANS